MQNGICIIISQELYTSLEAEIVILI